jgi:predicted nuclease of predicted toxin-antitoxin system
MDLYLDDCADADLLVTFLTNAGHRVETPRSAGLSGHDDHEHLEYAAQHGLALITKNPDDFEILHHDWQAQGRTHSGILLICQDNIKGKDMNPRDIVRAISNLLASGLPIANEVHILNHWR